MTTLELQEQFTQNKDNEKLKYDMEKLTRENEYLRHRMEEEKQEIYETQNLKVNALAKLKDTFGRTIQTLNQRSEKKSLSLINSLYRTVSELKSIDPKNTKTQELLSELMDQIEMSSRESQENFYSTEKDMKKLQMELDRISKIIEK